MSAAKKDRRNFVFPAIAGQSKPIEERRTDALEFMAHYLDRIESHLGRIAESLSSGSVHETLRVQLEGLQKAFEAHQRD